MKAFVKKDVCIGCGACTVIADNVFKIGTDGLAEVRKEITDNIINESDIDSVKDASESCPVGAIETEE